MIYRTVSARLFLALRIVRRICRPRLSLLRTLLWTSSEKSGRNSFSDAGTREFFASRNQSTSSSTPEPLSQGGEIRKIASRKTMIHDPDTSTFNSVDIYDELRRARETFFVGTTRKGLDSHHALRNS